MNEIIEERKRGLHLKNQENNKKSRNQIKEVKSVSIE